MMTRSGWLIPVTTLAVFCLPAAAKSTQPAPVPSKHPGVMVINGPATAGPAKPAKASAARKGAYGGWIYVKPGTQRPDIQPKAGTSKSTARTFTGGSKFGGVILVPDMNQMPAEKARRNSAGKVEVECREGAEHKHPHAAKKK